MRIINSKENEPISQADPYIFEDNGMLYIYATGRDGVRCYSAEKLDGEWKYIGVVLSVEDEKEYWAPCIYKENNTYYLYYSSFKKGLSDVHEERIKVATAASPVGPFTFVKDLLPPFSIDPHVVKSGDGLYMFYSINDYEAERAGTLIVVAKMPSPTEVSPEHHTVVRATLDEEIYKKDRFKPGQHWHTLEGAFYFREGDYHYIIYSGNCWENEYYYLGYAVAKTEETDLTKIDFKKYPSDDVYCPLIARNEYEAGTGHNSVIKLDGTYYCIYHGRDIGAVHKNDNRSARACKLSVADGVLTAIRHANSL